MTVGSRWRARRWRYLGYATGALLLVAVVLAVGSWLAVRVWGPELARERLEPVLTAALGRPTRVERVGVRPWLGRFVLEGVTVAALPGEPGPHFLTLRRIEANLGIGSLWRRRLVLRSIRLDDLDMRMSAGKGPGLREIPMLPEVVQAGPLEIELGTFELRRGRFVYDDAARATRVEASGLAVTLRPGRDAMGVTLGAERIALDVQVVHEKLERVEAETRIARTRIDVRSLAATWEGRGVNSVGRVDGPFDAPRVDVTVRGDVDAAAVGARAGSPWPLAGLVRVNGRLEGPIESPKVSADVAFDELAAGPVKARAGAARLALAAGALTVTQLRARAFDGSVTGSAVVVPAHPERDHVTVSLRNAASAALEELAGIKSGVIARIDADAEVRGDLRDVARAQSHIRLDARDVRLPGALASLGAGAIDAEARGDRGTFDLARGVATWPGLKLETHGQATADGPIPLRLKAAGELARLAPLLGQSRASGDGVLDATLTGRWRDPMLAGALELRSPAIGDIALDHAAVPFELTTHSLRLAGASARRGRAALVATGILSWPATDPPAVPSAQALNVDVAAKTEGAGLEDAAPWLPPALRGSGPLNASVQVKGTLAAWRARGNIASSGLTWQSVPPARDVRIDFDATPELIEVLALRASVLDAPLTAKGSWRWAGGGEIEAAASGVDLSRLPGLPERLRVEGRARASVGAAVRDGRVTGSGRVIAERLALGGQALGPGTADVSLNDSAVNGELKLPEARIAATAQGRLDGIINARATATDFEIGPVLKQLRPDIFGDVTGRITAAATLEVPARDPRATRGLLRLEPVLLETAGERWENRGPILVRREPGRLSVEQLELAGRLGTATAAGWVDDNGTIEGTVRGQVPFALLKVLRADVRDASGRLDLDVRVGGTVTKPALAGRGTISGGLLAVRDFPFVIRDMEGRLALSPARVRIEELKASVGSGTLRATGEAALDGSALGAYQVAVTGRSLGLTPVEGLDTVWNADLMFVGRGARGVVRGEAHLVRGSYTRDLSILPLLVKRGTQEEPIEWGRAIALHVTVYLDENLSVRSPQAHVRAGGTLSLEGTVAEPLLLGSVETQEGRITFRRHRFILENAVVRFDDPRRINPYLDVRATTRIRTYDVTMGLTGRADDLTIRLTSEPPLPQEDLLALVTLGQTREELGSSGGLAFAGEAAQMLSQELLGGETSMPLDIVEFGKTDTGQQQFRVGKRINDRTLVTYSGSFAEGGKQKLRVEYQIFGPLLVAGEQAFNGGFGGDVILRLRFR
jgi:translocation-and-assembly-module (TAM) inner membrane subunit TamB-like protein